MSFAILPLIQMSIKSGIIIIFIAILRKVFLFRFPKRVFLSLWMIAITRLLIPLSVSATFIPSFSLSHPWDTKQLPPDRPYLPAHSNMAVIPPANSTNSPLSIWSILWIAGAILVALYFLISYIITRLKFSESIPIKNKDTDLWLSQHPLRRSIQIRACTHITSPLAYGIFSPTILFPIDIDFSQTNELYFILQHEYTHIKYFHGVIKLLVVLCFCLHWFNPTVWILYFSANKDMELFCDEMVLREHNGKAKTDYAHALIHMSMGTAANLHLYNNFSERALKERIVAIMKHKKYSILSLLLALVLVASITCVAFASPDSDTGLAAGTGLSVLENRERDDPAPNGEDDIPDDDNGISPYAYGGLGARSFTYLTDGTIYLRAGQRVSITGTYSPTRAPLDVGIKNAATGDLTVYTVRNGADCYKTVTVPISGNYYVYVYNNYSSSVNYNLSYSVM
mgnify:CR=1 FL=1|jgi:beta-lactamase regulating signal transducer with metallopeptidase domain